MVRVSYRVVHRLLILTMFLLTACGGGSDKAASTPPTTANTFVSGDFRGSQLSGDTYAKMQAAVNLRDQAGNVLLLWQESDGFILRHIYRYWNAATKVWSRSQTIPGLNADVKIASATNGSSFLVVASEKNEFSYLTFDGTAWSSPQPITVDRNKGSLSNFALASNGVSYCLAFYSNVYNSDGNTSNNYALNVTIHANNQWSGVTGLIFEAGTSFYGYGTPQVVAAGDTYAVASSGEIFVSVYNGTTWSSGTFFQLNNTNTFSEFKLIGSHMGYLAAWREKAGTAVAHVLTRTYDLAASNPDWSEPTQMDDADTAVIDNYNVSIASNGTGFALVWANDKSVVSQVTPKNEHNVIAKTITGIADWSAQTQLNVTAASAETIKSILLVSNQSGYAANWYNRRTTEFGNLYSYYGAIFSVDSWLAEAALGIGSVYDNTNYRPIRLATNGSSYAFAWEDHAGEIPRNPPSTDISIYAMISVNDIWPATPSLVQTTKAFLDMQLISYNGEYGVIWPEHDGKGMALFASTHSPTGWNPAAVFVAPVTKGSATRPEVARNDNGTLVAVWQQFDAGDWTNFMNYKTGTTWSNPRVLQTCSKADPDYYPASKVISNGVDFMIFCVGLNYGGYITLHSYLYAIPFAGGQLGTVAELGQVDRSFNVATDSQGYAVSYSDKWRLFASGAWATQQDTLFNSPKIIYNGANYVIAQPGANPIATAVYDGSTPWLTFPTQASPPALDFAIASNSSGLTMLTWAYSAGVLESHFPANAVLNVSPWTEPVSVAESSINQYYSPSLAVKGEEFGILWTDGSGIFSNFYRNGEWGAAVVPLKTDPVSVSTAPVLTAGVSDFAATWVELNNDQQQFYVSTFRNSIWNDKLTTARINRDVTENQLIADGNQFRLMWLQNNPNDPVDVLVQRVWISDGF